MFEAMKMIRKIVVMFFEMFGCHICIIKVCKPNDMTLALSQ